MIRYTGSFNPALAAYGSSPSTPEHCCIFKHQFQFFKSVHRTCYIADDLLGDHAISPSLFTLVVASLISWTVYTRFFHPYSHIPGPFLASLSRFWLVQCVRGGKIHEVTWKLHERYGMWGSLTGRPVFICSRRGLVQCCIIDLVSVGSIVRISPDEVSVSDPQAVHLIYEIKSSYSKVGRLLLISRNRVAKNLRLISMMLSRRNWRPMATSSP